MKASNLLALAGVPVVMASCTEAANAPGVDQAPSAVLCRLLDRVFLLGSADILAAPEERPGWTRFGHDVWMDATEMTQAEYAALTLRNPSAVRGDSLPVTNVSWYDAVLAANARSRRDGLDTVYEYASVMVDGSGNATDLVGLAVHLDRAGWRLPTEAEWEAAARAGTTSPWTWGSLADSSQAEAYAWYQKNAQGAPHRVASKKPSAWGLFDMAGNVMEWVNDWKGSFPTDTIEEYAGLESPGDVAEVPLKGGSYNYGLAQLRPSNRTATYAAYRSSRAEYVGFRLCRGGFAARYASSTGDVVDAPAVTLLRTDLLRHTGSWSARLVFVNRANGRGVLTWIDYGEAAPVARSLPDRDPVFHPAISPDGRWVAWSTALEGSTGPSRIKARRLAKGDTTVLDLGEGAIPRWWVSGADTFLVRASALDNLSPSWPGTTTRAQRWSDGVLTGSVETWVAEGGYHDGRSGSYLYTGYRRLRQHDLRSGSSRVLFTGPGNGKGAGDTSQVCNVSASPDGSGRVLFLDFGYTGTSSVVGRGYGVHEIAFVADSTGRVLKTLASPAGEAQWEHMEWSNAPGWAVSGAIDGTGAYRNLYLVDLDKSASTRIVSGQELWQPNLWLGGAPSLPEGAADIDSTAQYRSGEFAVRGAQFWSRAGELEAVFAGSSHMANGVLPARMTAARGQLLAFGGSMPHDQDELVRNYILPHVPNLKVLVLSLMPGWLYDPVQNPSRSPWFLWRSTPGYLYDKAHGFWKDGLPPGFGMIAAHRASVAEGRGLYDSAGGMVVRETARGWSLDLTTSPNAVQDSSSVSLRDNLAILEALVADVTKRGVMVVMVKFPESPQYASLPVATRYGPGWPEYRRILGIVRSWEGKHPGFRFLDANLDGRHDYTDADAMNTDHLGLLGAEKFTRRLDDTLRTLLSR